MNYLVEFLKAFDEIKADCCVSPINEQGEQDEQTLIKQRADLIALVKGVADNQSLQPSQRVVNSPGGHQYGVKNNNGNYSITGRSVNNTWSVDAAGTAISNQKNERKFLSTFFGPKKGEQGGEQGGEQEGEQGEETTLTPEQQKQQQEVDRVGRIAANISKSFMLIMGRLGSREPICRLRLSAGMAKLKDATTKNRTAAQAYSAARAGNHCKAIKILEKNKMSTGFVSLLSDVERQFNYNYQNTLLKQLRNIRALSMGDIQVAFSKECREPKGRKECLGLGTQEVAPEESEAAIKNFERATELFATLEYRELTEAEKIELQGILEFTNDGMVLIKGQTKWLAFKDRNRQFYDLAQSLQTAALGSRKFKVHQMENYNVGDENSLRGKMKEHLHTLAGLLQQHALADGDPELQKDIDQSIKSVFSDLKDLCRYLKMSKDFVDQFEQGETSIPADSIPAFQALTDGVANLDNCKDLTPQLYRELSELMGRVETMGNPYVFQTGLVTGEGVRRDLVYAYETEEEALEGLSRDTGMPVEELRKYVQKRTVQELLDQSPELTRALADDRLSGPGAKFDREKVLFVIPEGIKSSLKGGPVKGGSGEEHRTLEAAVNPTSPQQKSWLDRTRAALGIPKNALPAAQKVLGKLQKELQKDEDTIMSLGDKVVKGKKETPHAYLESIKQSRLGPNAENDLVYTTADALQKEFKKKPKNPKRIEELKKQLVVGAQNSRVEDFYKKASSPRASTEQRHAMALLVTMPGTVGEEMLTTVYHEQKRGQPTARSTVDHNEFVCSIVRDWLRNPESATVNIGEVGASKYFGLSFTTPDGRTHRVNYEGRSVNVVENNAQLKHSSKRRKLNNSIEHREALVENILRIQTFLLRKILT